MYEIKNKRTFNHVPNLRSSIIQKSHIVLNKEKDSQKLANSKTQKMRSENKLINFSEMIPKLLDKLKSKNSSKNNMFFDNNSYFHDSNSSELNDDENDINVMNNRPNIIPKKLPKLLIDKTEELNEYKNLEGQKTFRQKRKTEKSPNMNYRKYSKENKDSLVLKLHKYFFQDGEFENIDTLIKYNINKIKICNNNNEDISTKKVDPNNNSNNNLNNNLNIYDFDYFIIKEEVIGLMDIFARAFDRENKNELILAIKELCNFSIKYKFDYVTQLTKDWLVKLQDKKYDNCELKYIGYYNQIRDIMDKMLKELKKKADMIIISQQKKKKDNKNENDINDNKVGTIIPIIPVHKNLLKKNSINKEDLLKTKEIVPIKIDIEVKNNLNINEVEEILKNLDEGDFGNLGNKGNNVNQKKLLNKHINRNEELEAFSYPFKENSLCYIF